VGLGRRCDGRNDCSDGRDELGCPRKLFSRILVLLVARAQFISFDRISAHARNLEAFLKVDHGFDKCAEMQLLKTNCAGANRIA
jgi:hypothetical protein